MRFLIASVAVLALTGAAFASPRVPSPEMDFGLAGLVMVAGAAFLARRRR